MNRTDTFVPTYELFEWQTRFFEDEHLTPTDLQLKQELEAAEEGRLAVDDLRSGVRITARS